MAHKNTSRKRYQPTPNICGRIRSLAITLVLLVFSPTPSAGAENILVLSAASLGPAVTEIANNFSRRTGIVTRVSTGSSGTLARQIIKGAPADIYIAAATQWIARLARERHLNARLTRQLLRNRLVIVSPAGDPNNSLLDLTKPIAVLNRLRGGRLAIGDPSHVPAGQYAKQAIEALGLWPTVRDHLARQVNVRAVLALVERGEAPLGVVYATDLALSTSVQVAAIVPADVHDPILYTAAVVAGRNRPEVVEFFNTLKEPASEIIYTEYGFGIVND
ncbi:MAG: molybdate ABC transporter substrate-binding protein [Rhodospirillaceae bacterium]|nr:molybdate ABC transporter substrate-binding protein [Rhodospirillaceae bacterium]